MEDSQASNQTRDESGYTLQYAYDDATEMAAIYSDDPDTQIGCTVFRPGGAFHMSATNETPPGFTPTSAEELQRPQKYTWISHAETVIIAKCAAHGVQTHGLSMVVTAFPCAPCAASVVWAGIDTLYTTDAAVSSKWVDSQAAARRILEGAGVRIVSFKSKK